MPLDTKHRKTWCSLDRNPHAGCGDSFWNIAASDRPAFINHDESIISYERLGRDVAAFAARLAQAPGLIGIYCDGHYRQYVAYLAALNARCPVVLMQPGQRPDRTGLSLSYLYSPSGDGLSALEPDAPPAWHPDLAVLLSTSGSTGAAKWVRLSAANIEANARSIALYLALTGQDCAPMALPFQYSYGMSIVNSHLSVGASLVLTDGSVVDGCFWDMFERAGCTSLAGVPHSFELMELAGIRTDRLGDAALCHAGRRAAGALAGARLGRAGQSRRLGFLRHVRPDRSRAAHRLSAAQHGARDADRHRRRRAGRRDLGGRRRWRAAARRAGRRAVLSRPERHDGLCDLRRGPGQAMRQRCPPHRRHCPPPGQWRLRDRRAQEPLREAVRPAHQPRRGRDAFARGRRPGGLQRHGRHDACAGVARGRRTGCRSTGCAATLSTG